MTEKELIMINLYPASINLKKYDADCCVINLSDEELEKYLQGNSVNKEL